MSAMTFWESRRLGITERFKEMRVELLEEECASRLIQNMVSCFLK